MNNLLYILDKVVFYGLLIAFIIFSYWRFFRKEKRIEKCFREEDIKK